MNRDEKLALLFFESTSCLECGSNCTPDDCHDRTLECVWVCENEDECGKEWTVRELMENALKRCGVKL